MTATTTAHEDTAALFRRAHLYQTAQLPLEAAALCRRILDRDPGHALAVRMLVIILIGRGDLAQAGNVLLDHLKVCPNSGASQQGLGQLKARQGDNEAAVVHLQCAARELPEHAPVFNDLGVSLHRLGRLEESRLAFDRATELDPAFGLAHANRGKLLFDLGRFDDALQAQLTALIETDPSLTTVRAGIIQSMACAAHRGDKLALVEQVVRAEFQSNYSADVADQLAFVLNHLGRVDEAEAIRGEAEQWRESGHDHAPNGTKSTILLIGSEGCNHTPTRYLVDPQVFRTIAVSLSSLNETNAASASINAAVINRADVVFNLLSDADRDDAQLAIARAVSDKLAKPLLNPPSVILKTSRDQAGEMFKDIPGMITPDSRRITAAELAALSIEDPILVRPAGDHGGERLVLVHDESDKQAFLSTNSAERLVLTPFYNFQSPDGHWRKYRLIFVDRQIYPYHLAIGGGWLVHYWRADMVGSDWKREEEGRFLADWRAAFGDIASNAVEQAVRRLDLDYCGMDCSVMPDGRLLLFEANATMLVHLCEPPAAFPHKHRYVPLIRKAFTQMVLKRTRQAVRAQRA